MVARLGDSRHDSNPTLGPPASGGGGGGGRGASCLTHFRKVPGLCRATGNLPRVISLGLLLPQNLTSYHQHQEVFFISKLFPLRLEPSPPRTPAPTYFHKVSGGKSVRDVAPPPGLPPSLPATRPPARSASVASCSLPTPLAPTARHPDTRGTNSARSCTRQTPVPLGLREILGETIDNSGRVLARFTKFPTARVVSESSSGRRWEGGVA